jgi:hypothetical protein
MRRLLPYEQGLIETLGISEEEYFAFLEAQQTYCDPKVGTKLDVRNGVDPGTIALVLTIVGTLAQVGAALLAPRPEVPEQQRLQRTAREKRFSPRYGFNSVQQLSQYGDPINLVYVDSTDHPEGAVRLTTSLVWSAIKSMGSAQLLQALFVAGAGKILEIDAGRTALGQLPIRDFQKGDGRGSKVWAYWSTTSGPPRFGNIISGDQFDPISSGKNYIDIVCQTGRINAAVPGYSQAFSPSSMNKIGMYDVVPINVNVIERAEDGEEKHRNLGIKARNISWGINTAITLGRQISIEFQALDRQGSRNGRDLSPQTEAANELRSALAETVDLGAIYKLGTALFKCTGFQGNSDLYRGTYYADMQCVRAGLSPSTEESFTNVEQVRDQLIEWRKILKDTTVVKTADGGATENREPFIVTISNDSGTRSWNFSGDRTIEWDKGWDTPGTLAQQARDGDELGFEKTTYDGAGQGAYGVQTSGSIASTQARLEGVIADKPRLTPREARKEYNALLEDLRDYLQQLRSGDYDDQINEGLVPVSSDDPSKNQYVSIGQRLNVLRSERKELREIRKFLRSKIDFGAEDERNDYDNALRDAERNFDKVNDEIQDLKEQRKRKGKKWAIRQARFASSKFIGYDGREYPFGIKKLKNQKEHIPSEGIVDQNGTQAIRRAYRTILAEKQEALAAIEEALKETDYDDLFYMKALCKIETASYETVSNCDVINIGLKANVYRRISGRANSYGEYDAPKGYKAGDNGWQTRVMFFTVSIGRAGGEKRKIPRIFAIRRGSNSDAYLSLQIVFPQKAKWAFEIEPVVDVGAETTEMGLKGNPAGFCFLQNNAKDRSVAIATNEGDNGTLWFTGHFRGVNGNGTPDERERGPVGTNEWDLFNNRSDTQTQFSFEGGPELGLTYVTEQQTASRFEIESKYPGLACMAVTVMSGRSMQDARELSLYVRKGKISHRVNENYRIGTSEAPFIVDQSRSTSYAPDIFADTFLDQTNGIGEYTTADGIEWNLLAASKRFCKANKYFMEGVIADAGSWREFWAANAGFSLLDLAKVGGKETLIPAVPYNDDGTRTRNIAVSALFNQGNILEDSFKEEFLDYGTATRDLIATVIYREQTVQSNEIFPRSSSIEVRLAGVQEIDAIRQTFDLSAYVTNRDQAVNYAQYLCLARRYVRRTIEFKTFPTETAIYPGMYIYVDIGNYAWNGLFAGRVESGGKLNLPLLSSVGERNNAGSETILVDGEFDMLLYRHADPSNGIVSGVIKKEAVSVTNLQSDELLDFTNWLCVLGNRNSSKRIFRVSEVTMDEEGEVSIRAIEHPYEIQDGQEKSLLASTDSALFDIIYD